MICPGGKLADLISKTAKVSAMEKTPNPKDVFEVKGVVATFAAALKNYTLYPEHHGIRQKSTIFAKATLDHFLINHEVLRLDVEESKLLFQGEVVHQDKPDERMLAFPLFRDGIQWFEWHHGLTIEELQTFLNILTKHRIVKEEAEDDLATALWEIEFAHVRYKVDEGIWVGEPLVDFSNLKANSISNEQMDQRAAETLTVAAKVNLEESEADFLKLNSAEEYRIREMIDEEETRNCTQDCLDVLVIILREQTTLQDYDTILHFLVGEIQYAMSQCEFDYILSFFDAIELLSQKPVDENPLLVNLFSDFRKKIATDEVLAALEQAWPQINTLTNEMMENLRRLLLRLPSDAIFSLMAILSRTRYPRIEDMLTGVVAVHACSDRVDMMDIVEALKERQVRKFITLIGEVRTENASKCLFDLAKRASGKVREYAVHTLLERDFENIRTLFAGIENEPPPVQHVICRHLGKQRSALSEKLLLDYLAKDSLKTVNREHILDCYRALGRCAGPGAIPFLQEKLLRKDLKAFFGLTVDPHRLGAAITLSLMPKEWNTDNVLGKAARSVVPAIRRACQEGEKENPKALRRK